MAVKLLEYDLDQKGMVLENIQPGVTLRTLFPNNDSKATKITAEIIKNLLLKTIQKAIYLKLLISG